MKTKPTKKVLSALKMLKKHIIKKCLSTSTSTSTKALVDKMLVSTEVLDPGLGLAVLSGKWFI